MTPGLAIFYAGMVRSKNVLGTIIQSFILISVITVEWIYLGYSMSFGPDVNGLIGDLSWFGLGGVGQAPSAVYAKTIPHMVFMIFQCMFAVITPALITGAFAERMRFGPFIVFSLLWAVFVYNPSSRPGDHYARIRIRKPELGGHHRRPGRARLLFCRGCQDKVGV